MEYHPEGLPFNEKQRTWLISSARGSGKTQMMLTTLLEKYQDVYTEIYWCSPSGHHDPKVIDMLSKVTTKPLKRSERTMTPEQKYKLEMLKAMGYEVDTPRYKHVNKVFLVSDEALWLPLIDKLANLPPSKDKRYLLVLDDMAWFEYLLKSQELNRLVFNARHVHVDLWVSIQYIKCATPRLRSNVSALSVFGLPNQEEIKTLMKLYPARVNGELLSDDQWLELYKSVTSQKYKSFDLGD